MKFGLGKAAGLLAVTFGLQVIAYLAMAPFAALTSAAVGFCLIGVAIALGRRVRGSSAKLLPFVSALVVPLAMLVNFQIIQFSARMAGVPEYELVSFAPIYHLLLVWGAAVPAFVLTLMFAVPHKSTLADSLKR